MTRQTEEDACEAFPTVEEQSENVRQSAASPRIRSRTISNASLINRGLVVQKFLASNPPNGMWHATGEIASKAPTIGEIRNGSFCADGWTEEGQRERRGTDPYEIHRNKRSRHPSAPVRSRTMNSTISATPAVMESPLEEVEQVIESHIAQSSLESSLDPADRRTPNHQIIDNSTRASTDEATIVDGPAPSSENQVAGPKTVGPDQSGIYPNGYHFPAKQTWRQATVIGLKAFWKFICTPFGFVVLIYGLNVVGWGAMIFFVLLNAAPAMCHPSCSSRDSARKKWIEIDSQILNALFCVTGLGLMPWRFRDLWWNLHWRLFGSKRALRFLAGIHRGWFRLEGSDKLEEHIGPAPVYSKKDPQLPSSPPPLTDQRIAEFEAIDALPLPATAIPPAPLTGVRAPPTATWKLDFVVWMYVINSFLQIVLCVAMWNWNRFDRPSWLQAFSITVACLVAILAGLLVFLEGKKVKAIEGIPVYEEEYVEDVESVPVTEKLAGEAVVEVVRIEKKKGRHWYERH